MMFLVAGAVMLVVVFLVVVGLVNLFISKHPNASVTTPTVSSLPRELALCDSFKPSQVVLLDLGKGEKHYQVTGDCPVSSLVLDDNYVAELEYRGWTVHDDGSGNLFAYDYQRHQTLTAGITDSNNGDNQATLSIEMVTSVSSPPDGFPGSSPSPSP